MIPKQRNPHKRFVLLVAALLLLFSNALRAAESPNDSDALQGLTRAKVIFDVRVPDIEKLIFNLALINETFDGMAAQGVKPIKQLLFCKFRELVLRCCAYAPNQGFMVR